MISHEHNCIFVHIPKCGGTSVEGIFLADLGLDTTSRAPLLLRQRIGDEPSPPRLSHLCADDYVRGHYISEQLYQKYYKFSVVRHPASRTASAYHWLGLDLVVSYDRFVGELLVPASSDPTHPLHWFLRPQVDFVTRDGNLAVDTVVKLEEIDSSLPPVLEQLGIRVDRVPHSRRQQEQPRVRRLRNATNACRTFRILPRFVPGNGKIPNPNVTEAIKHAYRDDYFAFGYK